MTRTSVWIDVGNVDEIPPGKMRHLELEGNEILIANVNGKFYAIGDRCGHQNARLSSGGLQGNIVTCPLHAAQFDVTTGKKLAEPTLGGHLPDMDKLPPSFLKILEHSRKMLAEIRTYDQKTYEVSVNDGTIQLKMG